MALIAERNESLRIFEKAAACGMSVAIFCTASYWNTEAILIAAQRIADRYGFSSVPVVIATTFTYPHMPQAERFLYCGDPVAGFLSHMGHLSALADGKYAPYRNVLAMPHLDHADPERDRWALTAGLPYFSSVMFDAQRFSYEKNLELTRDYVKNYGGQVLIEGIMEQLNVSDGTIARRVDNYVEKAKEYAQCTGIDFFVADLGTEQQTASVGGQYDRARALELTRALEKKMLVLHGTSCLSCDQIMSLASDGVLRVNMWTRIAREAGQYAAERAVNRIDAIRAGHFEAAESNAYIRDNVEKAADIMVEMMELYGYRRWDAR